MLNDIFNHLNNIKRDFGTENLFYRGHADARWELLPALGRTRMKPDIETILYNDFITRAGAILPIDETKWSYIFAMQHHGLPTRLLDWTTTFGVALYFALREGEGDAALWVLNPLELNKATWNREVLPSPDELDVNYYDGFIGNTKKFSSTIVAVSPFHHNPRIFNQKAAFTFHANISIPLEQGYPHAVEKIVIPAALRREAKEFLKLAGISEFSLFPDLDGLARDLRREHL